MKKLLIAALAMVLIAGCAANGKFVYKPAAPLAGGPKLPFNVAVLPFKDGTEDFTKRGNIFNAESLTYNLAKAGVSNGMTALTPDLWAKALADDMAASGRFQAVRFVYSPSELVDEDFTIEGTLEKANLTASLARPNEFALDLRAQSRTDNRLVWQKKVTREWRIPKNFHEGCGSMGAQCIVDRGHAITNKVMQGMFAEARADLLATLLSLSGSRAGEDGLPPAATPPPPAPESADKEIERILKGQ